MPEVSQQSNSRKREASQELVALIHHYRVHYLRMKNITLSADETLIEQARLVARTQHKTLNAAFREWLEQYAAQAGGGAAVDALMRRLRHVRSGGPYTRDEMNER
jgi:hypothetical protein